MLPENWQLKTYRMESFDGVMLHTEVYLPGTGGKYPVICIRDPYVLPPEDTEESFDECAELITAAYEQLEKGVDFSLLASKYYFFC